MLYVVHLRAQEDKRQIIQPMRQSTVSYVRYSLLTAMRLVTYFLAEKYFNMYFCNYSRIDNKVEVRQYCSLTHIATKVNIVQSNFDFDLLILICFTYAIIFVFVNLLLQQKHITYQST